MVYYVMGVSGSGKTTIGKMLAKRIQGKFLDGDDFHPPKNVTKMASGEPLNDQDRYGWLMEINRAVIKESTRSIVVVACSALKEKYRILLTLNLDNQVHWIYLKGDYQTIQNRMNIRKAHFMPSTLLQSQFNDLEEPKDAISINILQPVDKIIETIMTSTLKKKAEFGLIGLGVMGKSLSRNLARNGVRLAVYNRHVSGKEEDVAKDFVAGYKEMSNTLAFDDLTTFVNHLETPRKIFLMVNAGEAVDQTIEKLWPHLDSGDVLVDGGNSHYQDTQRRFEKMSPKGIHYIGSGVSGGERGALEGPSIMPGGSQEGYQVIASFLKTIAAQDKNGAACCSYIGKGGAGHFVKMVHNGIEYGEMQLITELYAFLRYAKNVSTVEIAQIFSSWNETSSSSYLLEITTEILKTYDGEELILDIILDKAGNKGTGSWTTIAASTYGVPIPTITAALYARYQSFYKEIRSRMSEESFSISDPNLPNISVGEIKKAYDLARLINHHQGFELIKAASAKYQWNVQFSELARIWTNGCIIRSALMVDISLWMKKYETIFAHPSAKKLMDNNFTALRNFQIALTMGPIAAPCFSASLEYLKGWISPFPTANMIQAQRDFFGAHTYERIDDSSGRKYHTQWEI